MEGVRAGPTSQGPSHRPSQEQGSQGGTGAAPASGTSQGTGRGLAGMWASRWAQLGGAHGWAQQGCGEPESGPGAASLGQRLTAPGGDRGSWHAGGWGKASGDPEGLVVCSGSGHVHGVKAACSLTILASQENQRKQSRDLTFRRSRQN